MRLILMGIALFFAQNAAFSDYRAFELRIFNEEKGTERPVISILDHIQYPDYYPINPGEQIEIIDSWMCFGNSSHGKPICPNPKNSGNLSQN